MTEALATYLEGIIDYAGLYPPAKLDLASALKEFSRHLGGPEGFIVNRFVCPVADLQDLANLIQRNPVGDGFEISVTTTPTDSFEAFEAIVARDKTAIEAFNRRVEDLALVTGYEIKLDTDPTASEHLKKRLNVLKSLKDMDLYLEIPFGEDLEDSLHQISDSELVTPKGRTGGTTPNSHPSPDSLARFIRECVALDLPFKLTAGLHHPLPTTDPLTGDTMHGFLNVGYAIHKAEMDDLGRDELADILSGGADLLASIKQVKEEEWSSVRELFDGFGSCSVAEPVDDLEKLGLW